MTIVHQRDPLLERHRIKVAELGVFATAEPLGRLNRTNDHNHSARLFGNPLLKQLYLFHIELRPIWVESHDGIILVKLFRTGGKLLEYFVGLLRDATLG
jgi:hypothetical protein